MDCLDGKGSEEAGLQIKRHQREERNVRSAEVGRQVASRLRVRCAVSQKRFSTSRFISRFVLRYLPVVAMLECPR
jgi:hypothetical protein